MEFENLQIEVPTKDDYSQSQLFGIKIYEKKYHNEDKDFVVGFNPNSKEFKERKAKRAKRFGLNNEVVENIDDNPVAEDMETQPITDFMQIDINKLKWPPVPDGSKADIRHDAIHVYGVEDMSTKDVFDYFHLYGPESLEWIDDYSCNVLWDDDKFVLEAMDNMSKTFTMLSRIKQGQQQEANPKEVPTVTIKDEDEKEENLNDTVIIDDDSISPKDIWRVALPYKSNQLFFRPATLKDKKLPGAAQRSEYYLKYGKSNIPNPNAGVVSNSRKRKLEKLRKTAQERFRTDEPDVQLVDMESFKTEEQKMEVDEQKIIEEEEPQVKRSNIHNKRPNQMTMVADKIELRQRLGTKYSAKRVTDRLGEPLLGSDGESSLEDDADRSNSVFNRIGEDVRTEEIVHRRLGTRKSKKSSSRTADVRDEIELSRKNNRLKQFSRYGYEDEHGIYHDIYRADDEEEEEEDVIHDIYKANDDTDDDGGDNEDDSENKIRTSYSGDLRDKLRKKDNYEKDEIKLEDKKFDKEKVNLCIEIKQEIVDEKKHDSDFEF